MKNIEKYQKEITNHIKEYGNALECVIATVAGIRKEKCYPQDCEECQKKCIEWMYSEYKEEILSDDEKDIIKYMINVIHKLGYEVNYVYKCECRNGDCFIRTTFKNIVTGSLGLMDSPYFNIDMFKGMKFYKEYNLEELGITCQTQKDNYVRQ